jgi:predicted acyltransferase
VSARLPLASQRNPRYQKPPRVVPRSRPAQAQKPQSLWDWIYQHAAVPLAGDTAVGSFLFAAGFVLVNWLFAWACYRRGVILKV